MVEKQPAGPGVLVPWYVSNDDPSSPLTVGVKSKKSDDVYFNGKTKKTSKQIWFIAILNRKGRRLPSNPNAVGGLWRTTRQLLPTGMYPTRIFPVQGPRSSLSLCCHLGRSSRWQHSYGSAALRGNRWLYNYSVLGVRGKKSPKTKSGTKSPGKKLSLIRQIFFLQIYHLIRINPYLFYYLCDFI